MNIREERERSTDRAWNDLYKRLEQDGLLTQADNRTERAAGQSFVVKKWMAGVVAVLAGAVVVFTLLNRETLPSAGRLTLYNPEGEPALVTTFEDGSIIYLSEQTSLEYPSSFAPDKREVSLQGDAFFEVSKSAERPFIIYTQTTIIEVLGTSFNVKSKDNDAFSLSVRTGKVKVTSRTGNQSVFVNAGETALLQPAGLRTLPTKDIQQFNRYLRHIHFKDQPLSDIVRIINENADSVQLKLAPELSDRRINITFRNNTPEEMAQILCLGLSLKLDKQQNILYINRPD